MGDEVVDSPLHGVADGSPRLPAPRPNLAGVEVDERVVADPAPVAVTEVHVGLDTEALADP